MRFHKKLKLFFSLLCAVSLFFSVCSIQTLAVTANAVTATTNTTVKQGNSGNCYVYIDSLESIASLEVTVHFDNTKVEINNIYNKVNCTLYDSVKNDSDIQFSYIFDGEGAATKTQLFYFNYQVLNNAEVGDVYFDITIGEACDNSLNQVAVSGSRCKFTIAETVINKSCSVYGSNTVSTAVEEEFSLSYRFSTNQIASGSTVITYDSELFELVSATNGSFLTNKVADINTDLDGSIYISFVGTEYNSYEELVTVKFRTLKNVTESSEIILKTTELWDLDFNAISCSGYTNAVNVAFDDSYVGDAPKMWVSADYDEDSKQVTAVIKLEENSKLGAGDFALIYNPEILSLSSYKKGFEPSFFNINDKEASDGIFKFSIISLEDILSEETIITVAFDATQACTEQSLTLDLSGSMLTDSLTNTIMLNLVDGKVTLPEKHTFSSECDEVCNLCDFVRNTSVSHSFSHGEDTECDDCEHIRILEGIAVSCTPVKTTYLEGKDILDVSGGSLTLYYNDGTSGVISIISDMVSGFNNALVGPQILTVTYGNFTDTYNVEILEKKLTYIEVTKKPSKLIYLEGDSFDKTGMVVTAYYNNDTSEVVTDYTISGYTATVGTQTITVTYGEKVATFSVTVNEFHIHSYTGKEEVVKEATCTEAGLKRIYCEEDGCVAYKEETISATGHTYGEWIVTKEPTEQEAGEQKHKCIHCQHEEAEIIEKLEPSSYVLGDVNNDLSIDANDALHILKSVAKMISLDENQIVAANVNRDAAVDANDALLILKYVAKMISGF